MGRDSTGKHQEKAQLGSNQAQATKDYAGRDAAIGKYDASVDSLAKNPGYSPTDLEAMRAEQGDQISAVHGNDATQLRQNAAETGNANDAGLYSQLRAVSDARSRDAAMGNNNIAGQQAQQVLETRRAMPGFRFQPAQLYSGSSSNLTNANTSLITGRQQADQTTPLWAQMGMTAMTAAGAAAACPAEGTLILMADGSEKPVEQIAEGELIRGVDGDSLSVTSIQPADVPLVRVLTSDGCAIDCSASHTFIGAERGFVVAFESLGKQVRTKRGSAYVISLRTWGAARVFDLQTDGSIRARVNAAFTPNSHSYRAGGVWALGVGDVPSDLYLKRPEIRERLRDFELLAELSVA